MRARVSIAVAAAALIAAAAPAVSHADTLAFSNPTQITTPNVGMSGPADVYPSPVTVTGVVGTPTNVSVFLSSVVHTNMDDFDIAVVNPTAGAVMLMSDACGNAQSPRPYTFDDAASVPIPDTFNDASMGGGGCVPGTYRPANYEGDLENPWPGGTPTSTGTVLAAFDGIDPNGIWNLYVVDDATTNGGGSIIGGWKLILDGVTVDPVIVTTGTPTTPVSTAPTGTRARALRECKRAFIEGKKSGKVAKARKVYKKCRARSLKQPL